MNQSTATEIPINTQALVPAHSGGRTNVRQQRYTCGNRTGSSNNGARVHHLAINFDQGMEGEDTMEQLVDDIDNIDVPGRGSNYITSMQPV